MVTIFVSECILKISIIHSVYATNNSNKSKETHTSFASDLTLPRTGQGILPTVECIGIDRRTEPRNQRVYLKLNFSIVIKVWSYGSLCFLSTFATNVALSRVQMKGQPKFAFF